jgi:hypothetical protein
VGVAAGNYCGPKPTCNCGWSTDAINGRALAQFNADVAETPSGTPVVCPCPPAPVTTSVRCETTVISRKVLVHRCAVSTTDAGVEAVIEAGTGDGADAGIPPSCALGGDGMTTCPVGTGDDSCCTSPEIAGGTFDRAYDLVITDAGTEIPDPLGDGGATDLADPATVSDFRLDKYDVTVARFRQFVTASANGWVPSAGSGNTRTSIAGTGSRTADPGAGTRQAGTPIGMRISRRRATSGT